MAATLVCLFIDVFLHSLGKLFLFYERGQVVEGSMGIFFWWDSRASSGEAPIVDATVLFWESCNMVK